MKYKMYCIFAKESLDKINGVRGKMATQAGHAYLHAFWDATGPYFGEVNHLSLSADEQNLLVWYNKRMNALAYKNSGLTYKITLIVETVEHLKQLQEHYKDVCGTALITDAGFTVFDQPTTTCLGLGPISEDNIGDDLKQLKTLT